MSYLEQLKQSLERDMCNSSLVELCILELSQKLEIVSLDLISCNHAHTQKGYSDKAAIVPVEMLTLVTPEDKES